MKRLLPPPPSAPREISIREYIATAAMNGLLAGSAPDGIVGYVPVAEASVKFADALIRELKMTE